MCTTELVGFTANSAGCRVLCAISRQALHTPASWNPLQEGAERQATYPPALPLPSLFAGSPFSNPHSGLSPAPSSSSRESREVTPCRGRCMWGTLKCVHPSNSILGFLNHVNSVNGHLDSSACKPEAHSVDRAKVTWKSQSTGPQTLWSHKIFMWL